MKVTFDKNWKIGPVAILAAAASILSGATAANQFFTDGAKDKVFMEHRLTRIETKLDILTTLVKEK